MVEVCTRSVDTGFVALGYAKVTVLGVVQGITELLPISSTAHMRLVPAVLGWQDPGSAFSAAMQLAALTAVVSYFWSDVRGLAANSLQAIARGQFHNRDFRFSLWIVLATVPIGIAGLFLAKLLNTCNSPAARHQRDRLGLRCNGDFSGNCGSSRPPQTYDRRCVVSRCNAGRHRASWRPHSRRIPLRLDPNCGARARL